MNPNSNWGWKEIDLSEIKLTDDVWTMPNQQRRVPDYGMGLGIARYLSLGLEQYPGLERDTQAVLDRFVTYGAVEFGRPHQPLNRVMEALFKDRKPLTDENRIMRSATDFRVTFGSPYYTPVWLKHAPCPMVDRQYPREYLSPFLQGTILTIKTVEEVRTLMYVGGDKWRIIDHNLFANKRWRLGHELDCYRQYPGPKVRVRVSK